jgi:predicted O-methyltransferase YrrM
LDLSFLKLIPGSRQLSNALRRRYDQYGSNPFLGFAPPGHFSSPLPDIQLVDRRKATLFDKSITCIPGIETNVDDQLGLLDEFSRYYAEMPFKNEKSSALRYYFRNTYFCHGDAIILYSMLRRFRPRRIIEVGCGFSSAVILDTNDLFFSRRIALTFVEPHPERLFSFLSDEDIKQHEVLVDAVQDVQLERFSDLEVNDILFIDSSHVAKVGSDVVHLLTNVLPRLNKGVIVHFHDVFWPFEYPEEWIRGGRAWNESYVLKAFLQFNAKFKILFFNSYLATHHRAAVEQKLPLFVKNTGGSLWLEKTS